MIELVAVLAAASIGPAYMIGRFVELRRWERQRDLAYSTVNAAIDRLAEMHRAEQHTLQIVANQRDLLDTFTAATETLYQRNDDEAWASLRWASQRARTELL